jgi:hypothetical protein
MKMARATALPIALLLVSLMGDAVQAQDAVAREILAFRDKVRAAVAAKDRRALDQLYADNYKHIRDTGRTDTKRDRINMLLSGEEGIETAAEEDIVVDAYGAGTAVATGLSPVKDAKSGRSSRFQWLTVYVRADGGWRIGVSQASRYTARQ